MARQYGRIKSTIWDDADFIALSVRAQRLYFMLLSQKKLTLVGSLNLRASRWAKLAGDSSTEHIEGALDELETARFIIVDHDTEELLIRSFTSHDVGSGRLNINLLKGFWRAWDDLESSELRGQVVDNCPDTIWDADQMSAPDEAVETRRSRRLEPLVPTVSSNQPFEPLVRTSLSPEALSPKPSSLSPEPEGRSNQRLSAEPESAARPLAAVSELPLIAYGFDAFWERYPADARVKHPEAKKAWQSARGNGTTEVEILQGLERWCAWWETLESSEYIPHPSRWLRNRQWNDPTPTVRPKKSKGEQQNDQIVSDVSSWLSEQGAS